MFENSNGTVNVKEAMPKTEVVSAEKLRILRELDTCQGTGEVGALVRREGIYSSYLTTPLCRLPGKCKSMSSLCDWNDLSHCQKGMRSASSVSANLEVFVADPYSIALSKLDRGLDTDFDDLVFLILNNHVNMDEFERILSTALPHARKFDFNPDILGHLQELKNRLK